MSTLEEIIEVIREKNKGDDKHLFTYLKEQDITLLNQLLLYYNPGTLSPLQLFRPIHAAIGLITSFACLFLPFIIQVFLNRTIIYPFYIYALIIIALISCFFVIQGLFPNRKKRFKLKRISDTQKIMAMIMITIDEKYKAL